MFRLYKEIIQTMMVIFLINFPASAGIENKSIIRYDENTQTVQFISELNESTVKRLVSFYDKHPFNTIVITSPGGDFDAGVTLANLVSQNDVNVVVKDYCNSACTIVFFSANIENRYMMKDAVLGLHNVSIQSSANNSDDTYITIRQLTTFAEQLSTKVGFLFALYAANGIPPDMLVLISKSRGKEAVIVNHEQLYKYGSMVN